MATTSFKRKTYGQVKEVKHRKAKPKKPDVRELARYYRAIAKYGAWQQLDNVCYAMKWWEGTLAWFYDTTPKEYISTAMARKIKLALGYRKGGQEATNDYDKIEMFTNAMYVFEGFARMIDFKVPLLRKYMKEGEQNAKKHKGILDKLVPKHEKHTSLLNRMFPDCTLSFVVVPRIIDPVSGKDIGRKMDHSKNTFYYSREMMKALRHVLRTRGVLALALEEAWWLSRAMSFKDNGGLHLPDPSVHLRLYEKLLENFEVWARRKDTPARLAKKPAKPKKDVTKEPSVLVVIDKEQDEIEEHLLNDPIISVEEIDAGNVAS